MTLVSVSLSEVISPDNRILNGTSAGQNQDLKQTMTKLNVKNSTCPD